MLTSPVSLFNSDIPWFIYASLCISVIGIFVLFISCTVAAAKCVIKYSSVRTPDGISLNELSTFEPLQRRPSHRVFGTVETLENVTSEGPISPTSRPQESGLRERLDMARTYNMDTRVIPVRKSFRRQQAIAVEMELEEDKSSPVGHAEEQRRPVRKDPKRRLTMPIEVPEYLKQECPEQTAEDQDVERKTRVRNVPIRAKRRATMTFDASEMLTPEISKENVKMGGDFLVENATSHLPEDVVDQSHSIVEQDKDDSIPYPAYVRPVAGGGIQIEGYPFVLKQVKKREV